MKPPHSLTSVIYKRQQLFYNCAVVTERERVGGREAQRLETRQRVYEVAIAEFKRVGISAADIGAIVTEAGVARGTFYFHFPTKEHVLAELERSEQARMAGELRKFLDKPHDLRSALAEVVRLVIAIERRLGRVLFRDMLALHFSPSRPEGDGWQDYPVIVLVVEEIRRAREVGEAHPGADPQHSASFFLVTLYALLITSTDTKALRNAALDNLLAMVIRGLEPR